MRKREHPVEKSITDREVTDGFGSVWEKCDVKQCGLEVVRPGKVQCWCDGLDMPATDVAALSEASAVSCADVAFIVGQTERRCRERASVVGGGKTDAHE